MKENPVQFFRRSRHLPAPPVAVQIEWGVCRMVSLTDWVNVMKKEEAVEQERWRERLQEQLKEVEDLMGAPTIRKRHRLTLAVTYK